MKILLDYVFPISVIESIPQASTAFLKQVAVVAKPKSGQEGNIGNLYTCTVIADVSARIDNTNGAIDEIQKLFDAGMSKVYLLLASTLDLETYMETHKGKFFTLLVSSDFSDDDVTTGDTVVAVKASKKIQDILYTAKTAGVAGNSTTITYVDDGTAGEETIDVDGQDITVHMEDGVSTAQQIADAVTGDTGAAALVDLAVDVGDESDVQAAVTETSLEGGVDEVADGEGIKVGVFDGVVGVSSDDEDFLGVQAVITRRCAFFKDTANKGKSMFYAFGKLLSNLTNWKNQQYIEMPVNDGVEELGDANTLFDDKISFVLNDDEAGNRLAFFVAGGKAIVAPYILKNLRIDMQSAALGWIALNQPQYTRVEATLLETRIQEDVINSYISRKWIESGTITITLEQENFVASGEISVPTPKALWRVFNEMTETT